MFNYIQYFCKVCSQEQSRIVECSIEVCNHTTKDWEAIKSQVVAVSNTYGFDQQDLHTEEQLGRWFLHPEGVAILARNLTGELIGFTFALPLEKVPAIYGRDMGKTAQIPSIIVIPKERGKGVGFGMHDKLVKELITQGYNTLIGEYRTENNFASVIQDRYNGRYIGEVFRWRHNDKIGLVQRVMIPLNGRCRY